ncbi:hypothetical protein MtrunA17_Chr6g0479941 [Medicago truncatula]|uniref:Uncharacterized protein n=1 Tax=Medicago truncatula TaxID=3880 RepID=A0A396HGL7_MEDTR|nr:hypothetical protein MtrunA17_Chr6g0479941 [Medicago truncatula]
MIETNLKKHKGEKAYWRIGFVISEIRMLVCTKKKEKRMLVTSYVQ